jgi:hypothetical protein
MTGAISQSLMLGATCLNFRAGSVRLHSATMVPFRPWFEFLYSPLPATATKAWSRHAVRWQASAAAAADETAKAVS